MEAMIAASAIHSTAVSNSGRSRIEGRNEGLFIGHRIECLRVDGGGRGRAWQKVESQIAVWTPGWARIVAQIGFGYPIRGRATEEGNRFPFLSKAGRKVMTNVSTTLDKKLGHLLLEPNTADNLKTFKSENGAAEGSMVLRPGKQFSKVDFSLESWIHATLPYGTLDIATVVVMLGPETDCPHFLFEFIQSGPTVVIVLDHLPRKDLVLHTEYQERFYERTGLEYIKQRFEEAPNAKPYLSPVLFVRTVVSPTAILYKLTTGPQIQGGGLEEQIDNLVYRGAQGMIDKWIESFLWLGLPASDVDEMVKRDRKIKNMGIEVDLAANLPKLFGQTITDRMVETFRTGGRIKC